MLEAGTQLAGYRIDGVLGRGGMGVVYEATQLALQRTVALKVIGRELGSDEAFRERFRREGLAQAALEHPNVVTVYEAGGAGELLYIAMRLVRGPSLRGLIRAGELDDGRTLDLLIQIADALDAAHERGLVHRDIKPPNVLVGPRDHAYLADFGLTKVTGEHTLTGTDHLLGTIDYLTPEQIKGEPTGARSDQYALAAVLHEALTGSVPFPKPTQAAVLFAHVSAPPPKVTERRPDLSPAIDQVIARGMAKDPLDRWDNATELIEAAWLALGGEDAEGRPQEGMRGRRTPVLRPTLTDPGRPQRPPPGAPTLDDFRVGPGPPPPERGFDFENVEVGPDTPAAPVPVVSHGTGGTAGGRGGTAAVPLAQPLPTEEALAATAPVRVRRGPEEPHDDGGGDSRRPGARALAIALGVAVLGGVIVGGVGSLLSDGGPPALDTDRAAGRLRVSVPSEWTPRAGAAPVPGLDVTDRLVVDAKGGDGRGTLVAGLVERTGAELLPEDFVQAAGGEVRQTPVRLGRMEAFQSGPARLNGVQGTVTAYSVPTDSGVATVACVVPAAGAGRFAADCRRAAATLDLVGPVARPLRPDRQYAGALQAALDRLAGERRELEPRLRQARRPPSQARRLRALGRAWRRAADTLDEVTPGPREQGAHVSLVDALRAVATGYENAGTATERVNRPAYEKASAELTAARGAVTEALRLLARAGYAVD